MFRFFKTRKVKSNEEKIEKKIEQLTCEEMRIDNGFPIHYNSEDNVWLVCRSICQLGGCEFNAAIFSTEIDALKFAMRLTLEGKKLSVHACPSCYREYIIDCI